MYCTWITKYHAGPDYDFVGPWATDTVRPPVIINKSTQIEFRILEISLFYFYNIMSTLGPHDGCKCNTTKREEIL